MKDMKVHATIYQEVYVDPKQVVENLKQSAVGSDGWVYEKDGKYWQGGEESAGCHSIETSEEISKAKYEYVQALELVLKQMNKKL